MSTRYYCCEDKFIQVVSCNTHNLSTIVKTLTFEEGYDNLIEGRFVLIRRANDLSQSNIRIAISEGSQL